MNKWEVIDNQFERLKYLLEEGYISDPQFEIFHNHLVSVITTEDASKTDREGEQLNEVGFVRPPDNAEASRKTEINDDVDSILNCGEQ